MRLLSLLLLLPAVALADVTVNGTIQVYDAGVRIQDDLYRPITSSAQMLDVSRDIALVSDRAVGTTLNTNVWTGNVTTQTIATSGGFYALNASGITTINTTSQLVTIKQHSVGYPEVIIDGEALVKTANLPLANSTAQLGFFSASALTAPTDGCYFEWNASAEFRAVTNFNGTILQSGVLSNPSSNIVHTFRVRVSKDACEFRIDNTAVVLLPIINVGGTPTILGPKLPFAARIVNGAVAPLSAPSLQLASLTTVMAGADLQMPGPHQLAGGGRGAYQSPITTFAQTANWANSTSPVSIATLSNTAAGYSTLGGRWQFAAPLGAATDYIIFGYQVPTGLQLRVTGIRINSCNTGAAVATTATVLDWGVAVNSSAVSLATTDALGPPPTAWAPRRAALGVQGFVVGAAIGACAPDIVHTFATPLVVDSGRFFHVIVQVPVGTATPSQVIRGDVFVEGYFE